MVAEDRSSQYPHKSKPLFSAVFDKRSGLIRYDPPTGWRLNRDTQLRLTRAFAQFLAWADHVGLRAPEARRGRSTCMTSNQALFVSGTCATRPLRSPGSSECRN